MISTLGDLSQHKPHICHNILMLYSKKEENSVTRFLAKTRIITVYLLIVIYHYNLYFVLRCTVVLWAIKNFKIRARILIYHRIIRSVLGRFLLLVRRLLARLFSSPLINENRPLPAGHAPRSGYAFALSPRWSGLKAVDRERLAP